MKYGVIFVVCAVVLLWYGHWLPGLALPLWWMALSMGVVGIAYLLHRPQWFGKDADGGLAWWSYLVLGPYLALMYFVWWCDRALGRKPACQKVCDGLWIGRRLLVDEYPEEVEVILDLTAEFAEPRGVTKGRVYLCVPILDASVPDLGAVERLLAELPAERTLYIHCAQGHGRTGTIASALLLYRGVVSDVSSGLSLLQEKRPSLRINDAQRSWLEAFALRCAAAE